MQKQLEQVREFHRRIGADIAQSPRLLPHDRELARYMTWVVRSVGKAIDRRCDRGDELAQRTQMALEELSEWIEAHVAGDVRAAADAWADRSYLLFGDAVATGMPAEAVFDEVHRSNMTKSGMDPTTGKAVKSDGYRAPSFEVAADVSDVDGWRSAGGA